MAGEHAMPESCPRSSVVVPHRYRESADDEAIRQKRERDEPLDESNQQLIRTRRLDASSPKMKVVSQPRMAVERKNKPKVDIRNLTDGQLTKRKTSIYPLHPAPVLQLTDTDGKTLNVINCGNYLAIARLRPAPSNDRDVGREELFGTTCVRIDRLQDKDWKYEEAYICFADLHIKHKGEYYLEFHLFEMVEDMPERNNHLTYRCSINSDVFKVYGPKDTLPSITECHPVIDYLKHKGFKIYPRRPPAQKKSPKEAKWDSTIASEKAESSNQVRASRKTRLAAPVATSRYAAEAMQGYVAPGPQYGMARQQSLPVLDHNQATVLPYVDPSIQARPYASTMPQYYTAPQNHFQDQMPSAHDQHLDPSTVAQNAVQEAHDWFAELGRRVRPGNQSAHLTTSHEDEALLQSQWDPAPDPTLAPAYQNHALYAQGQYGSRLFAPNNPENAQPPFDPMLFANNNSQTAQLQYDPRSFASNGSEIAQPNAQPPYNPGLYADSSSGTNNLPEPGVDEYANGEIPDPDSQQFYEHDPIFPRGYFQHGNNQ